MVDELNVTIAPKIAGGRLATTLVEGDGFDQVSDGIKLRLERVERKKSGELVLRYRPE
jgi:2,5-diamino-6-(ribosylamino)-4(3H)-pyrimidinone 5'-phosphate reductase